jgi:hypothetical protein
MRCRITVVATAAMFVFGASGCLLEHKVAPQTVSRGQAKTEISHVSRSVAEAEIAARAADGDVFEYH